MFTALQQTPSTGFLGCLDKWDRKRGIEKPQKERR